MTPIYHATIVASEMLDPKVGMRTFNAALAAGHEGIVRQHAKFLPRHTRSGAAQKYGYAPRNPKYVSWARKQNPYWSPLHLSGQLESSLKQEQGVSANSKMGKLMIRARLGGVVGLSGRYRFKEGQFALTKQQEQIERRRAEIAAVTADEVQQINTAGSKAFVARIALRAKSKAKLK